MIEQRKGDRRQTTPSMAHPPPGVPERRKVVRRAVDRFRMTLAQSAEALRASASAPDIRFEAFIAQVVACLTETFQVRDDEVSLLLRRPKAPNFVRFAWPAEYYRGKLNFFPLTGSSVAGKVVQQKQGILSNTLATVPHLHFYERLRLKDRNPEDIQKMIAAPLVDQTGEVLGVLEISRKGKSPTEAGPDFGEMDLLTLTDFGKILGAFVRPFLPVDF